MKKTCTANLIFDENGNMLFLKRVQFDTFHPSTLCLPGGGVEELEDIKYACIRETIEEAGLKTKPIFKLLIQVKDCDIYYFTSIVSSKSIISLDFNEHEQYHWLSVEEFEQRDDYILDLKKHVAKIIE